MSDTPRFVTRDELAQVLRVSKSTVDRWQTLPDPPPSVTWGMRRRLFEVEKVLAWLRLREEPQNGRRAA